MGKIRLTIDNKTVEVEESATVLQAAREAGIYIPTICYHPSLRSDGNCGLCLVEIQGRPDSLACVTPAAEGMVVATEATKNVTAADLAKMIVGRDVLFRVDRLSSEIGAAFLELQNISALNNIGFPALEDISIAVQGGEILGLAGIAGNGQKELVDVAVRSWIITSDNSSIHDVLPRKMLSQSGLGILAHGIGNLWNRPHSHFESA